MKTYFFYYPSAVNLPVRLGYFIGLVIIILIDCGIALKEVPLSPCSKAVSIVALESRVDRGSNAIPVHPITSGSLKLPVWFIREAEETLENKIRGPQDRQ